MVSFKKICVGTLLAATMLGIGGLMPTAEAGKLEDIQARGTLLVGSTGDYKPMSYLNKETGKYTRVILDADNYRSKREKTLVNLANRLAGKVERTRHSVTLEPMNPYERKVIHCTLQNHPKVKTRSEGKDPYRKVIIELK